VRVIRVPRGVSGSGKGGLAGGDSTRGAAEPEPLPVLGDRDAERPTERPGEGDGVHADEAGQVPDAPVPEGVVVQSLPDPPDPPGPRGSPLRDSTDVRRAEPRESLQHPVFELPLPGGAIPERPGQSEEGPNPGAPVEPGPSVQVPRRGSRLAGSRGIERNLESPGAPGADLVGVTHARRLDDDAQGRPPLFTRAGRLPDAAGQKKGDAPGLMGVDRLTQAGRVVDRPDPEGAGGPCVPHLHG